MSMQCKNCEHWGSNGYGDTVSIADCGITNRMTSWHDGCQHFKRFIKPIPCEPTPSPATEPESLRAAVQALAYTLLEEAEADPTESEWSRNERRKIATRLNDILEKHV